MEPCMFANVQRANTNPVVDTIEFWNRDRLDSWLRLWFPSHGLTGQWDFVSLVRRSQTTQNWTLWTLASMLPKHYLSYKVPITVWAHTRASSRRQTGGSFTKRGGTFQGAVSAAFKWPHLLEPKIKIYNSIFAPNVRRHITQLEFHCGKCSGSNYDPILRLFAYPFLFRIVSKLWRNVWS